MWRRSFNQRGNRERKPKPNKFPPQVACPLRPPHYRRSPYLDHSAPNYFATENFKTREMQAPNVDSESENGDRTLRAFPTGRKFHKKFFIFPAFSHLLAQKPLDNSLLVIVRY
jgi:hypothetical protein